MFLLVADYGQESGRRPDLLEQVHRSTAVTREMVHWRFLYHVRRRFTSFSSRTRPSRGICQRRLPFPPVPSIGRSLATWAGAWTTVLREPFAIAE